jgi:ribosomal protein L37AE/L43A
MPSGDRPAWLWPIVLLFVVLPAAVGFWVFVVPVYRAYRMRFAGAKTQAGEACPACGNEDLEPIGPEVFQCKNCRLVSGAGVAARRRQLRKESIQRSPPAERIAAAASALREARLILVSAQALLNDAASRSKWDIAGLSMDRGQAKQSSFGAAVRNLRNAEELANDALELLAIDRLDEPMELDTSPVLLGMDTAWLTDGVIPNVAIHLRIEEAQKRAGRMLERVEASLASLATLPRPRRVP